MIGRIVNQVSYQTHQSTQVDPTTVAAGPSSTISTARVQTHHLPSQQIPSSPSVGQDETFQKVWSFLKYDNNGIIGIYGMGGVGKTTLLERVHTEFLVTSSFDVIIWIVVSKDLNEGGIQKKIMSKLGLSYDPDDTHHERAIEIHRKLCTMTFALLIDDIWEHVDMEKLGIPDQVNKSKIIFTTRSEDVCAQMKPHQKVKVDCLERNDAWILFKKSADEKIIDSDPSVRSLAKQVAEECRGLPLALKVIGRAMAGKRTSQDWEYALTTLRKSPSEIAGTEKKLFSSLKFSYDALPNQKIKDCFLYCCLFPEDWSIDKERLIGYWVGEGFLGINESLMEAKNSGHAYISILTASFLLEREKEEFVKMHDVIRNMAIWIVSDYGKQKSKFFVHPSMPISQIADRWREAERIFLRDREGIPEEPVCSMLSTLITNSSITANILDGILNSMPQLRVLDLYVSRSTVDLYPSIELSPAIGQLLKLRYLRLPGLRMIRPWLGNLTKLEILDLSKNKLLMELPNTIGQLVELRQLNLSDTNIKTLPAEMGKLSKLEVLNLRNTHLTDFPTIIGKLAELRYLNLLRTRFRKLPEEFWELKNLEHLSFDDCNTKMFTTVELCKLAKLQNLKHLEICTDEVTNLQILSHCLTTLRTRHCPSTCSMDLLSLFRNMDRLSNLHIISSTIKKIEVVAASNISTETTSLSSLDILQVGSCRKLTKIEVGESSLVNLRRLFICDCCRLKHITGLKHLQRLEELTIKDCGDIEEVISINEEETGGYICFPKLKKWTIHRLNKLKSICSDTVSFPSLEKFHWYECPSLKKLPLGLMNKNRTL